MNNPTASAATHLSPGAILLIQLALALGGFAIGTGEFAIMGLMPNVAADLGVSEPDVYKRQTPMRAATLRSTSMAT